MKIIFSRKGFDSGYGGYPSPILPDGSLFSFPIPSCEKIRYRDLTFKGLNVGEMVNQLTNSNIQGSDGLHLDPDLNESVINRKKGWRPLFGQCGTSQAHLENEKVGQNDIFLFFGWFKQTESLNGKLKYVIDSPDVHLIFGWLQIDSSIKTFYDNIPKWAEYHPHCCLFRGPEDTVYTATEKLKLGSALLDIPGGGVFNSFSDDLVLTEKGQTRSIWNLPKWAYPEKGKKPLSYHKDIKRWTKKNNSVSLKTVGRGQEFVLDLDYYSEGLEWLSGLFLTNA